MGVNAQNIMNELSNTKNWKGTQKKNYEIYACMPPLGTKVSNFLEGSHYVTDEDKKFVISGTRGERWTMNVKKLAETYCFLDGAPITAEALAKKAKKVGNQTVVDWMRLKTLPGGGPRVWAFHLPASIQNFPVTTSWGERLLANRPGVKHGTGDFLVASDAGGRPNLQDVWVVNGEVFPDTYDMRAFPGLGNPSGLDTIPVPKSILPAGGASPASPSSGNSNNHGGPSAKLINIIVKMASDPKYKFTKVSKSVEGNFGSSNCVRRVDFEGTDPDHICWLDINDKCVATVCFNICNNSYGSNDLNGYQRENDFTLRNEKDVADMLMHIALWTEDQRQKLASYSAKFATLAKGMAGKLGFSKVDNIGYDADNSRVEIYGRGAGYVLIEFLLNDKEGTADGNGTATYMDATYNAGDEFKFNIKNKESIRSAMMFAQQQLSKVAANSPSEIAELVIRSLQSLTVDPEISHNTGEETFDILYRGISFSVMVMNINGNDAQLGVIGSTSEDDAAEDLGVIDFNIGNGLDGAAQNLLAIMDQTCSSWS